MKSKSAKYITNVTKYSKDKIKDNFFFLSGLIKQKNASFESSTIETLDSINCYLFE